jgi:hypothetical protein
MANDPIVLILKITASAWKQEAPNMLDKATLEKYLESDTKSFVGRIRRFFGGKQNRCFQFKYSELGIDLIKRESAYDLKAKYKEMGVTFDIDLPELEKMPF